MNKLIINKIIPGSIFRHYKNMYYLIEGVARHTETLEEMVVYRSLYKDNNKFNDFQLWTRPKNMFTEKINVNGKVIQRFEYVE
jgi:hypothetical protein